MTGRGKGAMVGLRLRSGTLAMFVVKEHSGPSVSEGAPLAAPGNSRGHATHLS
jgi:hypothetical protein